MEINKTSLIGLVNRFNSLPKIICLFICKPSPTILKHKNKFYKKIKNTSKYVTKLLILEITKYVVELLVLNRSQ